MVEVLSDYKWIGAEVLGAFVRETMVLELAASMRGNKGQMQASCEHRLVYCLSFI